jgi:hypothetical protein
MDAAEYAFLWASGQWGKNTGKGNRVTHSRSVTPGNIWKDKPHNLLTKKPSPFREAACLPAPYRVACVFIPPASRRLTLNFVCTSVCPVFDFNYVGNEAKNSRNAKKQHNNNEDNVTQY